MSHRVRAGFIVGFILNLLAAVAVVVIPHHDSTASVRQGIPAWGAEFMVGNKTLTKDEAVAQAQQLDLIAATKGMYRPYVSAMKAANPDLTLLVYLNGTFAQSNEGSAYPEAWYQRDANGHKIRSLGWDNYLMDPTNPGWIADVGDRCASFLAYSDYDGCILDVLGTAPLNPNYVTSPPQNPATGKVYTTTEWLSATANIAARVTGAVSPRPVFGNGIMFGDNYFRNPGSTSQLLDHLDGGMSEMFLRAPSAPITQYRSEAQWKRDIDMLVDATSRGKHMITTTKVWTSGTQAQYDSWHRFALASFLLGYAPGKSYFTFRYDRSSTFAHPYWEVPIGTPTGPYTQVGGLYQREFTGGRAIVNPSTSELTVNLGGEFTTLDGDTASRITLPPHSGQILTPSAAAPSPTPSEPATEPTPTPTVTDTAAPATTLTPGRPSSGAQNSLTQFFSADFMTPRSRDVTLDEAVTQAKTFDVIIAYASTFRKYVAQMREANPDLILLAYENGALLATRRDPSGTLYPDSWYAKNCAGNKVRSKGSGAWLMNVRDTRGSWVDNRVSTAVDLLNRSGYDGIFMDMVGPAPAVGRYVWDADTQADSQPAIPQVSPCTDYTPAQWMQLTKALVAKVEATTGRPVYGNGLGNGRSYYSGAATSSLQTSMVGGMAGAFVRSFSDPVGAYPSEDDWRKNVDMLVDSEADGEKVLAITKLWVPATQEQTDNWYRFSLATFLLGADGNSYFSFRASREPDAPPMWADVHLGVPLGEYRKVGGAYQRWFASGGVLVNPGETVVQVPLDGKFFTPDGQSTSSITLAPHTAEIVLASSAPAAE